MSEENIIFQKIVAGAISTEGPHWQPSYEAIVYVDTKIGRLLRYFPSTGRRQQLIVEKGSTGEKISFVLPIRGYPDILLIGHGKDLSAVIWGTDALDCCRTEAMCLLSIDPNLTQINYAKCDPQGRIWVGYVTSLGPNKKCNGSIFMYSGNLKRTEYPELFSSPKGLGWSPDRKKMYFILDLKIVQHDYDDYTGAISLKGAETIIDYKLTEFANDVPNGMTVDGSGNIWVANLFGEKIVCIDPATKSIIKIVKTPVINPTSICFGASDYSTMYITSGVQGYSEEKVVPAAGTLLALKHDGVEGLPSTDAVINSDVISRIKRVLGY